MRKKAAPADRRTRIRLQIGDPVLERQANIAYGTYVLKALHRFDLLGKSESISQQLALLSLRATTGENVPNKRGRASQPKAGGAKRSREI
jgi:hypothetical protein